MIFSKTINTLSLLKGWDIVSFIQLITKVFGWIMLIFHQTDEIKAVCESLRFWRYMKNFMTITTVVYEEVEKTVQYRQRIQYDAIMFQFDKNVRRFYNLGHDFVLPNRLKKTLKYSTMMSCSNTCQ